jgi:hypothetical protein
MLPMLDLEVVEQAVRGKIKVKWFVNNRDKGRNFRLRPLELAAYEEAKRNRFVVYKREGCGWGWGDGQVGAYYYWCRALGEPYVRVLKRKAHAEVSLDMISTNRCLGEEAIAAVGRVLRRFSLPGARLYWGECYNQSTRVRLEGAERLAAILYAIATDFKPRV